MNVVENACLVNLITKSIFFPKEHKIYNFDPDLINKYKGRNLRCEYNRDDCRFFLLLSLMVTNNNYLEKKIIFPEWLETTELLYEKCPLKMIDNILDGTKYNKPGNIGYFLYNKITNTIFIVFTGTSNACLVGSDLNYKQEEIIEISNYIKGAKAHQGIYNIYLSVRERLLSTLEKYLKTSPKIYITGHSLGGALSSLCSLDLAYYNPINYSFASPLLFNPLASEIFQEIVKHCYRIVNLSDLVVNSPLSVMPNGDAFCHVGAMYHFQYNYGVFSKNHGLAYMEEFDIPYEIIEDETYDDTLENIF